MVASVAPNGVQSINVGELWLVPTLIKSKCFFFNIIQCTIMHITFGHRESNAVTPCISLSFSKLFDFIISKGQCNIPVIRSGCAWPPTCRYHPQVPGERGEVEAAGACGGRVWGRPPEEASRARGLGLRQVRGHLKQPTH